MAGILDQRTIDDLTGRLFLDGMTTVQAMQHPPAVVQVRRRRDGDRQFSDVGDPVPLISLKFADRDEQSDAPNQGRVHVSTVGELKAFAPLDLRRDDRFAWQGQTCVVLTNPVEFLGVVKARVQMIHDRQADDPEEPEAPDGEE